MSLSLSLGLGLITPEESGPAPARYWRAVKRDAAVGGNYHKEMEFYTGGVSGTKAALTGSMITFYDLQAGGGTPQVYLVDGNIGTIGFWTDTADPGAYVHIDLGSGNEQWFDTFRFWTGENVHAEWDIQYSYDNSAWVDAAVGLDVYENPADDADSVGDWRTVTW